MGFRSIAEVTNAIDNGQIWTQHWYKAGAPFANIARWEDFSVGAGTPTYQPYAAEPLVFSPQTNTANKYIYTGPTIPSTQQKYLFSWQFYSTATTILSMILLDVMGFYGAIDGDSTDVQTFDNTLTLPRYTSGEGVQMLLISQAPSTANAVATVNYTNNNNTSQSIQVGLLTQGVTIGVNTVSSSNVSNTNSLSPFTALNNGEKGIRSVQSIQLSSPMGGLLTLVLAKPILNMQTGASSVPTEKTLINQGGGRMPEILPGAALTMIGTVSAAITPTPSFGQFNFVWG
jgi:hypothetical protein